MEGAGAESTHVWISQLVCATMCRSWAGCQRIDAQMPRVVPTGSPLLLHQTQILPNPSARGCSWTYPRLLQMLQRLVERGLLNFSRSCCSGHYSGAKSITRSCWQVGRESCQMMGNASFGFTWCLFLTPAPTSQLGIRKQKC